MATIAEERAANARARAEGYESAAHKEAHANVGASSAGYANAVQQEIAANIRAQAEGFASAAEKEMDANRRSQEAGFLNAVDQEIDANRRAREAGFLNAADLETYGAAEATRSTDPFVDPRTLPAPVIPEQFRLGTANFPQYNVGETDPLMPASGPIGSYAPGGMWGPPTQGGGGYGILGEHLVPPTYTGPASIDPYVMQSSLGPGWEHQYPINPNGMITGWGGPGGYAGGGTGWGGGGGGLLGPMGGGGAGAGGNTTTDASGNQWVMSSDGQWVPAGSAYGQGLLGDARLFPAQQYDSSGGYIGSEGTEEIGQDPLGLGKSITNWMGAWSPEVQRAKAAHTAGLTPDQSAAMAAANAAQAGTGFADMYGGTDYDGHIGSDPTAAGFIDWDI